MKGWEEVAVQGQSTWFLDFSHDFLGNTPKLLVTNCMDVNGNLHMTANKNMRSNDSNFSWLIHTPQAKKKTKKKILIAYGAQFVLVLGCAFLFSLLFCRSFFLSFLLINRFCLCFILSCVSVCAHMCMFVVCVRACVSASARLRVSVYVCVWERKMLLNHATTMILC